MWHYKSKMKGRNRMKKSILAILLALVMVASLLPFGALADGDTNEAEPTPTGSGNYFFANGVPITITDSKPSDGTVATVSGFTATGESAMPRKFHRCELWDTG